VAVLGISAAAGGKYGGLKGRRMLTESAKGAILEVQVNATLSGHDIGPFEPVDTITGGYQAVCRKCGKTALIGDSGVMYSLLGETCEKPLTDCG
jgi:hypothetical protein